MSNAQLAIQASLALSQFVVRAMEAQARTNELLAQAHAENRDLTDDEIARVQSDRDDAMSRWESLG